MDGDIVTDFAHDVKACALGQASSSIMARHVVGATAAELRKAREDMLAMLKADGEGPDGRFEDMRYLQAGQGLQGAPCLDDADLRCGRRCDRTDRGEVAAVTVEAVIGRSDVRFCAMQAMRCRRRQRAPDG